MFGNLGYDGIENELNLALSITESGMKLTNSEKCIAVIMLLIKKILKVFHIFIYLQIISAENRHFQS